MKKNKLDITPYQKYIKWLKYVPFYIALVFDLIVILLVIASVNDVNDTGMPWNWEGGGWHYKSPEYYLCSLIHTFVIMLFCMALSIRQYLKKQIFWATLYIYAPLVLINIAEYSCPLFCE